MAGFKSSEPRDRRGKWVHDPFASPHETAMLDLAVIRRKAYDSRASKMTEQQLGTAYPSAFERFAARVLFNLGGRRLMRRM